MGLGMSCGEYSQSPMLPFSNCVHSLGVCPDTYSPAFISVCLALLLFPCNCTPMSYSSLLRVSYLWQSPSITPAACGVSVYQRQLRFSSTIGGIYSAGSVWGLLISALVTSPGLCLVQKFTLKYENSQIQKKQENEVSKSC